MQITTGKSRTLKYKSPLVENNLGKNLEGCHLMV